MLTVENTVLVVVDVQGKLAQLMHDQEALFRNLQRMIRGAQTLEVPILWCEQNPAGLGPTAPEIAGLLAPRQPLAKMSFSCWGCDAFQQALQATGRQQVLLTGIEAHVCVYLTAADLVGAGYEVEVVADAVSSRSPENKRLALGKVQGLPAALTCTETALFQWLGTAAHPRFRDIARLLK